MTSSIETSSETPGTEVDVFSPLTPRELQTARYLALGFTNREIAGELGISIKTVDSHRSKLLKKLAVRNNVKLARLALQHRLVTL